MVKADYWFTAHHRISDGRVWQRLGMIAFPAMLIIYVDGIQTNCIRKLTKGITYIVSRRCFLILALSRICLSGDRYSTNTLPFR